MKLFYRGVILLAIAAFIGESLELVINIVLARELGETGLGLYMSILPTIMLIAVLASMELPISISKFVAEKDKRYHRSMLFQAIGIATVIALLFLVISLIVVPQIPVFDQYHPYVKLLVYILIPIISFSSVFRGYFMGSQQMGKIAISNFLRRALQLLLLVIVYQLFQFEHEVALLVALCTLIASEFVVFAYMATMFFIQLRSERLHDHASLDGATVRKGLMSVSLPMTGVRIFHSVTFAVKPFLIKYALVNAGLTEAMATAQFGKLAGVAFSIGFFPAFIAHSLLIVLIPTVAEAYAKQDYQKLQQLLIQVMKLTLGYGLPSVLIFYFFAEPLTGLFFKNSPAVVYLQLLVPYFLFHFFVIPLQAYLIGLGMVKDALLHAVWSTFISFLLMYFLGSNPSLQMHGIIIGMNTGVVLLTLMHYMTVCHKIGIPLTLRTPTLTKI
ncbi:polysaccharide biosynthesis protein [Anaerobacillus alkaliphilus]|uniref:Polysaccharide biosynthesis protein n=1 Tax=Anaerobacillus alkaliphilus TaxID=1548597 RepID=A0A4Q0VX82_9BACI|nr:polysaccharide biosynthesis protein [Anaerobacillus alkaliphilus]RXJ04274.1 polysaccharide biosynthesis protein [Anaerobacillus alkaliphilus]